MRNDLIINSILFHRAELQAGMQAMVDQVESMSKITEVNPVSAMYVTGYFAAIKQVATMTGLEIEFPSGNPVLTMR